MSTPLVHYSPISVQGSVYFIIYRLTLKPRSGGTVFIRVKRMVNLKFLFMIKLFKQEPMKFKHPT